MPKIVNTDEKKREIARFALEIFLNLGYQKTTIQSISRSSGIGRSTFYQYFENKEEIFLEAMLYLLSDVKQRLQTIVEDSQKSIEEKCLALFVTIPELPKGKVINVFELSQIISSFENQGDQLFSAIEEMQEFLVSLFKHLFEDNRQEEGRFLASLWKSFVIMYYENSFSSQFMTNKINQLSCAWSYR